MWFTEQIYDQFITRYNWESGSAFGVRLRKFDRALEEAAFNLGANRARAIRTITLPFLLPAIIAAFLITFFVSLESFNTTLMLVGSDAPLTITMYDRMVKGGATPVLNAVSLFLILGSGCVALVSVIVQRDGKTKA